MITSLVVIYIGFSLATIIVQSSELSVKTLRIDWLESQIKGQRKHIDQQDETIFGLMKSKSKKKGV